MEPSLTYWDQDAYETITVSQPCHCGGRCTGTCNGMISMSYRARSPEEYAKIKAERIRREEDEILRLADAIRAFRATQI